jgi:hypothetical protein
MEQDAVILSWIVPPTGTLVLDTEYVIVGGCAAFRDEKDIATNNNRAETKRKLRTKFMVIGLGLSVGLLR